ncbi:hypothetical protein Tco_1284252 [Tanacetum coccineum]
MISRIPIGGGISPEGFLPSILLLVVIIVSVVIIAVILVVVVIAIVGVVIVVMFIRIIVVVGGVSSIFKPLFVFIGWAYAFHQDRASSVTVPVANFPVFATGVPVGPVFLLGLLALAIVASCASKATAMPSAISCWMAAKDSTKILEFKTSKDRYKDNGMIDLTIDEDPTDEDKDIGVSVSSGDEIFSEGKESRESNIGDSNNTRDGGKTADRAIITWGGGIASLISELEGTIV